MRVVAGREGGEEEASTLVHLQESAPGSRPMHGKRTTRCTHVCERTHSHNNARATSKQAVTKKDTLPKRCLTFARQFACGWRDRRTYFHHPRTPHPLTVQRTAGALPQTTMRAQTRPNTTAKHCHDHTGTPRPEDNPHKSALLLHLSPTTSRTKSVMNYAQDFPATSARPHLCTMPNASCRRSSAFTTFWI